MISILENDLETKKLLIIAPHLKYFIDDQTRHINPFLGKVSVVLPIPRFSKLTTLLPFIGKNNYAFLRTKLASLNPYEKTKHEIEVFPAPYFTLPLEVIRKRDYYLASRSSLSTVAKASLNFDVIHAHFLTSGYIGAKLKEKFGKPFILTIHGGEVYNLPYRNDWYYNLVRFILARADCVVAASKYMRRCALSLGVSSKKLYLIPNGYDEKLFKPISLLEAREKLGLPTNKQIVLSVGNLFDVKGHTDLLNAMSAVLKERNNVILVIVGSGPLERKLRKTAKNLCINSKILLTGMKRHEEIPLWMNACNLFVLPSLNEGFGTVIPEAMACGKPVVATRVGGIPDTISNDDAGILVDPGDPMALTSAILDALDRKWRSAVILNHVKKYRWSHIAKQIISVYQDALS